MALDLKREPFTYHDLENFPEDGKRREVIGGELFVSAAPSTRHQRLIVELVFRIRSFLETQPIGTVFAAPTEVLFDEMESVEPDIFVVLNEGRAEITERRVLGAPDWVIEVLSPSNSEYDLETKRKLYARYGVVYWVVDPIDESITAWDMGGKAVFEKGDELSVSVLPGFKLEPTSLFSALT